MAWGGNQRNPSGCQELAGNLTCRNTTEIATARDRAVEQWTRGKRDNWAQQDLLPMASSKGFTIIPDATGLEGSYGDPASPRTAKTLNMRAPTTQGSNPTIAVWVKQRTKYTVVMEGRAPFREGPTCQPAGQQPQPSAHQTTTQQQAATALTRAGRLTTPDSPPPPQRPH